MSIGDNEEERNLSYGMIIMTEIEDPIAFYGMPKLWMIDSQEFIKNTLKQFVQNDFSVPASNCCQDSKLANL